MDPISGWIVWMAGRMLQRLPDIGGGVLLMPVDCHVSAGGRSIGPGQCGYAEALAGVSFPPAGLTLIAQPC